MKSTKKLAAPALSVLLLYLSFYAKAVTTERHGHVATAGWMVAGCLSYLLGFALPVLLFALSWHFFPPKLSL